MKQGAKIALVVEVIICFGPALLYLMAGIAFLPMQVMFLRDDPLSWEGFALIVASVVCGICGLAALIAVLTQLFSEKGPFARPGVVFAGIVLGLLPLAPSVLALGADFTEPPDVVLILTTMTGILPLICTLHIVLLSRHILFPVGSLKQITAFAALSLAAPLLVYLLLQWATSLSLTQLQDRHAVWVHNRPAMYQYDLHIAGVIPELVHSKRIRVRGVDVVAAEYIYPQSPLDTIERPPPKEWAWTMDQLFDELAKAQATGASIRASFDQSLGHVTRAYVEYDDETPRWDARAGGLVTIEN